MEEVGVRDVAQTDQRNALRLLSGSVSACMHQIERVLALRSHSRKVTSYTKLP